MIADVVCERSKKGMNYGTVLIPEGLLHHLPLFVSLIEELNQLLNTHKSPSIEKVISSLSPWGAAQFTALPPFIQTQLLQERDVHGGIQLSQIESERLLAFLVDQTLQKRASLKTFSGSFATICHFFGYQGRSAMPSEFDCTLGTAYGFTAGVLIESNHQGYSVTARNLRASPKDWHIGGIPLM